MAHNLEDCFPLDLTKLCVVGFEGEIKKKETIQRKYTFYHEAHSVH
jgi:hypothetical protein